MTEFLSKIDRLHDIAEDAAEGMVKHRGLIEKYVSSIKKREHPYTQFALVSFIPKVESIMCGMFAVCRKEETYSFRILQRSLIEHYCKFMFIWIRYGEERNDEVGKEYFIFGGAKEGYDYVKAVEDSAKMIGGKLSRSPADVLNELMPSLEHVTVTQLTRTAASFTYKNTAKYIHQRLNRAECRTAGLMSSIIPLYSDLSSFVHGGPSSVSFCRELENPGVRQSDLIESLSVAQMMAFHVQSMTYLFFYQHDKAFGEPYHIMNRSIAKICELNDS